MNYLKRVAEAGARTAVPYRAPAGVRLFGTEASGALDAEQPAGASYEDTVDPGAPASPSPVAAIGVPPPDPDRPMRALDANDAPHPRSGVAVPAPPGQPASHVTRAATTPTVTVRVPRGFADPPPVARGAAPALPPGAQIPGALTPAATPSAAGASSSRASSREASSSANAAIAASGAVSNDPAMPVARASASSSVHGSAATPLSPGTALSPADAQTMPQSSPSLPAAAASSASSTGASQQAASSVAFAQHLADHAAGVARPKLPQDGIDAGTPSPHSGEPPAVLDRAARVAVELDRAARVAVPFDRAASGTMRAGDAPRTSVTIGTIDVHVAPPPQPVAPPPREAPRAAPPRRSAVETRFLDRFLLGG